MSRALAFAGTIGLVAALAACGDDPPDPDPAAEAMAAALASGDFGAVPLAGTTVADAEAQLAEIVEGMDELPRSVEVRALVPDDDVEDGWDVTFDVSWDLTGAVATDGGEPWAYTTTAQLRPSEREEQDWEIDWSPALVHPELGEGDRLRVRRQSPERGEILGAGGSVLVTDRDVYRIGIDKTKFDDATTGETMAASARELADVVGVDADGLSERVLAAGDKAFVETITLRAHEAQDLLDDVSAIAGAAALPGTLQLAPTREFARPILGAVGDATAEIVEESEGRIQAGDQVGLSGLQRQYDDRLRGIPGVRVEIVPAEGDASAVHETEPVAGEDLPTTLDVDLQMLADSLLADVEPASAIVAMHTPSGDVLAAASGPGGEGYSTATLGQYAPGSTFKVVTALALLRAGLTPETTVECPRTLTVDGREFGNYSAYPDSALGSISLTTAIAESCNTAMMSQRDQVSQQDLADAAASLGLGVEVDLDYPGFLGSVPGEAEGTAHAAAMIGQGEILASPLAMATVAASVAAGEPVVPRLITGGEEPPAVDGSFSADEAAQLRDMMYAAVNGGSASFLQNVPGEPVGAKTGTAEYGTESPPRTHAWMIAFQGDLAVAVFVEDGESGSQTAGPILQEFFTRL